MVAVILVNVSVDVNVGDATIRDGNVKLGLIGWLCVWICAVGVSEEQAIMLKKSTNIMIMTDFFNLASPLPPLKGSNLKRVKCLHANTISP